MHPWLAQKAAVHDSMMIGNRKKVIQSKCDQGTYFIQGVSQFFEKFFWFFLKFFVTLDIRVPFFKLDKIFKKRSRPHFTLGMIGNRKKVIQSKCDQGTYFIQGVSLLQKNLLNLTFFENDYSK